jgi:outer membrane protein OmpA-like peptidoglycan-associated protein
VYSKDREKLSALATAWQQHVRWAKITIEGYASGPGNPDLARARADKIRGYLIRYGVDPGYIVAVGRDHPRQGTPDLRTTGGRVDLSISFCSRSSEDCPARTATAQR